MSDSVWKMRQKGLFISSYTSHLGFNGHLPLRAVFLALGTHNGQWCDLRFEVSQFPAASGVKTQDQSRQKVLGRLPGFALRNASRVETEEVAVAVDSS